MILGDLHAPFHCRRVVAKAIELIKRIKPKVVVQVGDLLDFYAFSRYPRSLNLLTPQQEIKSGRRVAEDLWEDVQAAAGKKVECFQLMGNHDSRLAKRIAEALPEVEGMVPKGLWTFDGVTTIESEREELILDGVVYMHGYRKHGDHVKYNLMSTVHGHHHTGGVVFLPVKNKILFELDAGYLANFKSPAMSYGMQSRVTKWTHGVGVIDADGPRFVPL